MPIQDASAFTMKKRVNAIQSRGTSGVKVYTRLYHFVPVASALTDFLPSFTNKSAQPLTTSQFGVPPPSKNSVYVRRPYIR